MNHKQLLENIRIALGGTATTQAARLALDSFTRAVRDGLLNEGNVRIAKFGVFRLVRRRPRRLVLPRSGESITLPLRNVVTFDPSPCTRLLPLPIEGKKRLGQK